MLKLSQFIYAVFNITDEGGIPSQFPVQEETQFLQLLRESLDFFSIDEKFHNTHVLIDYKTRKHISKYSLLYVTIHYYLLCNQNSKILVEWLNK